jgi:predicted kinase
VNIDNKPDGRLVILAGLPGAGKTTLATWLAEHHGFVIASRDTIRAAMFPSCKFTPEEKADAFEAMKLAITTMLDQGMDVVTDGMVFSSGAQLTEVQRIASHGGHPTTILHCKVPVSLAQQRVEHDRLSGAVVPADRDASLVEQVAKRFEPLPASAIEIDTSDTHQNIHNAVIAALMLGVRE